MMSLYNQQLKTEIVIYLQFLFWKNPSLTNSNTNSNSEDVGLLLKTLSTSHHLQNRSRISLLSFQGVPLPDPNVLPFKHSVPQPTCNSERSPHTHCTCLPSCTHTTHYAWMFFLISDCPNAHSSGHWRLPTHDPFSLSYLQQYVHARCRITNHSPSWGLRKNQAQFLAPEMSLASLMQICTFLHPDRWLSNLQPRQIQSRQISERFLGAKFLLLEVSMHGSEFQSSRLPFSTCEESSRANRSREK